MARRWAKRRLWRLNPLLQSGNVDEISCSHYTWSAAQGQAGIIWRCLRPNRSARNSIPQPVCLRRSQGGIFARRGEIEPGFGAPQQRAVIQLPGMKAGAEESEPTRNYLAQQSGINQ